MPNTINLHLLDNKQIKVDMGGIPLGNENSYRIYQGEENATQFTIASKPTQYANADYYIIFINSQNKRAFLDDIIPEPIPDDGQLLTSNTFTLPKGMAVKGYGYIRIYCLYTNDSLVQERVEFQPCKVKIWETIDTWKDYVTELGTIASQEWVEQYVTNALAEIDLSGYYTKTQVDGLLNNKQNKITGSNKLGSDYVDDTNQSHKFVTASEKASIATHSTQITDIQSKIPSTASSTNQLLVEDDLLALTGKSGSVTIQVLDWDNNVATKTIADLGDNDLISFYPSTIADKTNITNADIFVSANNNVVIFTATNTPQESITFIYFITRGAV